MARLIPNENVAVHFVPTIADINAPTVAEIGAGQDLTSFATMVETSTRGQTRPTPALDSLFETNIPGTASAQAMAEFYRDSTTDTAWTTLPRGTSGYLVINRFNASVAASENVEVWPIKVTTRTMLPMTSNEVQRFRVEMSVPVEPDEDATVAA